MPHQLNNNLTNKLEVLIMTKKVIFAAYGMLLDFTVIEPLLDYNVDKFEATSPKLLDYKLVFGQHANIEPTAFDYVPVGLWEIEEEYLDILDQFEGVFSEDGVQYGYYKRSVKTIHYEDEEGNTATVDAHIYEMCEPQYNLAPSKYYLDHIRLGYDYFGLDEYKLDRAIDERESQGG